MEDLKLTNEPRNEETENKIKSVEGMGLGQQTDKHVGIAQAIASLDIAESLQLLQLQVDISSKSNNKALETQVDKLIGSNTKLSLSNDKNSFRMILLTGALVFVGLLQCILAFESWHIQRQDQQNSLEMRFDDKLNTGTNYKISIAIDKNNKILQTHSGIFTEDDLDSYLGIFQNIYDNLNDNSLTEDQVYTNFNDVIIKAYKNQEIKDYLILIRKDSPDFYLGFDELAKHELKLAN